MERFLRGTLRKVTDAISSIRVKNQPKYFCVGRNKTGTTSLKQAFEDLGYIVGHQRTAEQLYDKHFFKDDFDPILKYCKTGQVFQDVPFSYFKTLPHLDKHFPDSKYILTIRDDADQWYQSITKFHSKLFGRNGQIPTYEDLQNATYVRKGLMTRTVEAHGTTKADPYNKTIMCAHYEKHNSDVLEYFKDRQEDLLVINLSQEGAYKSFIDFLGVESPYSDFPWENKT
jgi:hypothetical protein